MGNSIVRTGTSRRPAKSRSRTRAARREGISAIILILSAGLFLFSFAGVGPRQILAATFCLNLALLIFSWRRYRDVQSLEKASAARQGARRRADVTGLPDIARFEAEATSLINRCARQRAGETVLLALKLDQFSRVGDIHGREITEALLQATAAELLRLLPENACAAHAGGGEFAIAFNSITSDRQTIIEMVDGIARGADWTFRINGKSLHTSCTFGAAFTLGETLDYAELRRRSLLARRFAMRKGPRQLSWYGSDMDMEVRSRNAVEDAMRAGIRAGEFVPYFERQIDLATGKLSGFEMLTRWHNESFGTIPMERVINIAEKSGQIEELSQTVFRAALSEASDWDPALTISVNISPFQMRDPWLAEKLLQILVETGFPATRLEVEITESALVDDFELARNLMNSLKNQGIRIALDDFGTGYSSLQHLRSLPFDRLKIDKSFIQTIDQSPKALTMANSIATLADAVGLPITAEGIETPQILDLLKEMGCEKGQGWHFGRPIPAEEAQKLARPPLRVVGGIDHRRHMA